MKNIIKEADFRRDLKANPAVGYLFFGEEDYLKSNALRLARKTLSGEDEGLAYFNDIRLGGADFTPDQLLDAMATPPMGSDRKVITVTGINFNTMRTGDLEHLLEALSELGNYPFNVVIVSTDSDCLDPGTLPKRPSKLLTELGEYLIPVNFEKNTPAKLAGWVQKHYLHHGVDASPELCHFTVAYCGRDMYILASEIQKVAFYVLSHGRNVATEEDIKIAAIPAVEYDAFAFTNAITERRRGDALDILADLKFRRVEPLFILSEVSRVVCDLAMVGSLGESGKTAAEISIALKMHEYRVGLYLRQASKVPPERLRAAVLACREADAAMKGALGSAGGYGVIEKLICSL
ncbi:MAG: DNA polymerase III subunit delta [Ruminococcaceae bacterium]|nr:DNA polymerase III subunit delta [Oscillospiraceae bacterium]